MMVMSYSCIANVHPWLRNHPSSALRAIVTGHGPSACRRGDPVDSGELFELIENG